MDSREYPESCTTIPRAKMLIGFGGPRSVHK
jgi:hypothetical protein